MSFTITDIKKQLGPGLGLRKNRYLIEIPIPTVSGETINILCQSAGLPERTIQTTEIFHKGRKYVLRGEMDFGNDYEISIVDDDEMRIRRMFDAWMQKIDNTRPDKNTSILGTSFESISPTLLDNISAAVSTANTLKNSLSSTSTAQDFVLSFFNDDSKYSPANYQVDINIWQLGRGSDIDKEKIYGYKLQNAFPKSVGIVTLEDGEENSLSQFSVNFAFSEFIPLIGNRERALGVILGEDVVNIGEGIENLFDL